MLADIPPELMEQMQRHFRRTGNRAHQAWDSASADEDSLTGDVFGRMRKKAGRRQLIDGRNWKWSAVYRKFRGRGLNAPERTLGADGIIELVVMDESTGRTERKGILFQAKVQGRSAVQQVRDQSKRMRRVAPSGAAVVEFGPQECIAVDASHVQNAPLRSDVMAHEEAALLGDYLADRFLACKSGTPGMYVDSSRGELLVPSWGGLVGHPVAVGRRLRIKVWQI